MKIPLRFLPASDLLAHRVPLIPCCLILLSLTQTALGRSGWLRCSDEMITAIASTEAAPLVLVGTHAGAIVPVYLDQFRTGDPLRVPGPVTDIKIFDEGRRWVALSIEPEQLVVYAGSIDQKGELSMGHTFRIMESVANAHPIVSHGGDKLAITILSDSDRYGLQLLSTSTLSPLFSANYLENASPWNAVNAEGDSDISDYAASHTAFFGDNHLAYASYVGARKSVVNVARLDKMEEETRLKVPGRLLTISPSLCGKTFRVHHDSLADKRYGLKIERYTGNPAQPWLRELTTPRSSAMRPKNWIIGEADCGGDLLLLKTFGPGIQRRFQLWRVSAAGTVKLVDRLRHGYQYRRPACEISSDRERLVFFEPGANAVEVIQLDEGAISQSHATEFSKKHAMRLELAGEDSRFAVLTHLAPFSYGDDPLEQQRKLDWNPHRIYVVELERAEESSRSTSP